MRIPLLACMLLVGCVAPGETSDSIPDPLTTPTEASPRAVLEFAPGWVQVQHGAIVRGGHVDVTYARARMGGCADATVMAYARFSPGGQMASSDEAFGFDVPANATKVELWFHAISPSCDQWDSSYGANWQFPVIGVAPAPVGWVGDWGSSTDRACTHGAGVPEPIQIDEYMRERACIFIDADIWVPGTTDTATTHSEWIEARVAWAKDALAPVEAWLTPVGVIGHNARFRWSVPYELRNQADWTTARYAFQFSTDGIHWTRAAQSSGLDRTITRAFVLPAP